LLDDLRPAFGERRFFFEEEDERAATPVSRVPAEDELAAVH
jgi:hypothetical protein